MNKLFNETEYLVDPWKGFAGVAWKTRVDVRDFIQNNYTPYLGDASFLSGPTARTRTLWAHLGELL